jgi:hypothetical protein
MFFADTARAGAVGATRCGLDYLGPAKLVFASDFPFDAEGGSYLVRETIKALDALKLTESRAPRAGGQCDLRTVFPKVISGLRRPIAIQAAISLNMNLPE